MKPQKLKPGDKITAANWNALVNALEAATKVSSGTGVNVRRTSQGLNISLANGEESWFGQIVLKGPEDEDPYADARYWVQRCEISNDEEDPKDGVAEITTIGDEGTVDESQPRAKIVTATNLAEMDSGGHILALGQLVYVTKYRDHGSPPQERYIFNCGQAGMYMRITSAAAATGATNRWGYSWVQSRYVRNGLFEDVPSGFTSSDPKYGGLAYNVLEANNTASGLQGNGVNISALPNTFNLQPIPNNAVVYAIRVATCDDPTVKQWVIVQYVNAVTGACPTP